MLIYGAGGHCKVVIDTLNASGELVTGVVDDFSIEDILNTRNYGKYSCNLLTESELIIAIGSNETRKIVAKRVKHNFGQAIHPSSYISSYSSIGHGTVVFAQSVIQPSSVIKEHVIINTGAKIDHDCQVDDFAHIAPGATLCGGVTIGEGVLIGAGATILPGVSIANWTTIGAGSVVTKSIIQPSILIGNPAKPKKND